MEALIDRINDDSANARMMLSAYLRTRISKDDYRDLEDFADCFSDHSHGIEVVLRDELARKASNTNFLQPPLLQRWTSDANAKYRYTVNQADGTVGVCSTLDECLKW